ncbi:hypothetical protein NM208_g693 [Fusarium decemcellulare]|uniref:Uncharacterized protein n=1 Tax=Fusarium decemcellulare TaxID=57161 RepID=A0ACC1SZA5_9HYPO|nr:hypothetical protein NM208_g693 [Fusarium decemcellulare]
MSWLAGACHYDKHSRQWPEKAAGTVAASGMASAGKGVRGFDRTTKFGLTTVRPGVLNLVDRGQVSPFQNHQVVADFTEADMEPVYTPDSVNPIGPYSQAIKANGFVFVSGQIPATPQGTLIEGTVAEKTHKMCQNAKAVLEAARSGLEKVVKVHVYFETFDDFKEFNEVYAEYFPHKPARTSSEAPKLPVGASLMLDITALQ